ncbi:hypothetical protein AVEN_264159-1 [Araneus ventricosus]|uniref:Uncharacterized protein n=1 Tax=Araneus ventricosus TaxID=182803 RepID=A0A4Y2KJD2_ARAVE|nr:hypothetical protein AVEN_264159-1 [Araneus ventricosus]
MVSPAGRDVTWNDLAHSWRIFSPNRDIEKIPAPLRSHISSPDFSPSRQVCRQGQGSRWGCCRSSHIYPCKTLFPTIRLTLLGSDFFMFVSVLCNFGKSREDHQSSNSGFAPGYGFRRNQS